MGPPRHRPFPARRLPHTQLLPAGFPSPQPAAHQAAGHILASTHFNPQVWRLEFIQGTVLTRPFFLSVGSCSQLGPTGSCLFLTLLSCGFLWIISLFCNRELRAMLVMSPGSAVRLAEFKPQPRCRTPGQDSSICETGVAKPTHRPAEGWNELVYKLFKRKSNKTNISCWFYYFSHPVGLVLPRPCPHSLFYGPTSFFLPHTNSSHPPFANLLPSPVHQAGKSSGPPQGAAWAA